MNSYDHTDTTQDIAKPVPTHMPNIKLNMQLHTEEMQQYLLDLAAEADEREAIRQSLEDVAAGRMWPADEVFDELRKKYNIPSSV